MSPSRPGIFDLVATDLVGYRRIDDVEGRIRFAPDNGGVPLEVSQRVKRRFMGRTTIARFHTVHPHPGPPGHLRIGHIGRSRRVGVEVKVVAGEGSLADFAGRLGQNEKFVAAVLPLDFTFFEIISDGDCWRSTIELMGATMVAIALPPIRSYVRLYPDQLSALQSTITALNRVTLTTGG